MRKGLSLRLWVAVFTWFLPSLAGAAPLFWNVFNIEEETAVSAQFVTYASLVDMLNDDNRLDVYTPDGFSDGSFGNNIVGSGAFVMVTASVPEPGTVFLFGFGLSGIGVVARRRKTD